MTVKQNSLYFKKGRFGLLWLLNQFQSFKENTVTLVPEFICNSLTDALTKANIRIAYYKVDYKFSPCQKSILELLDNSIKIESILYVNYFGIPAEIDFLKSICQENNIILIEDNSHGFGGESNDIHLGEIGDISFSSPKKLYGNAIGGVATINSLELISKYRNKSELISLDYKMIPLTSNYYYDNTIYRLLRNKFRIYKLSYSDQESPFSFREKQIKNFSITPLEDNFSQFINWDNIFKSRARAWKMAESLCSELNLKPIYDIEINKLCPWAFPARCLSMEHRNKIILHCYENSLAAFSWPCLPDIQIDKSENALRNWKELICIPLNKVSTISMERMLRNSW
ncbi:MULTISPECIES: DegT/DnrJ/EryC1/StrS family aminotransferase [Prochlorococcus]|uniref:DegT/DnrJ/EryC1/StrS family aminotransferase n=1 Tax=Prochlorococcus TaxID=1218 RepID=UPI00053378E7|nr:MULTISPECIES: DegT/DnrJ/EryC1/StrS family aminotransferase [Prochlorococcus]KGG12041.1 DegT/DnrJ/EryC1/StrS aminotransferase [Prochlorococcus sp. MIT 0601]